MFVCILLLTSVINNDNDDYNICITVNFAALATSKLTNLH